MITYVDRGSILDDPSDVLVCTVCTIPGVMGAGQAKAFADRWPQLKDHHRKIVKHGTIGPGLVSTLMLNEVRADGRPIEICFFPTKVKWWKPSRLEWIANGLRSLILGIQSSSTENHPIQSIACPALGCGLGGLPWDQIKPLIELAELRTPDVQWTVYLPGSERRK